MVTTMVMVMVMDSSMSISMMIIDTAVITIMGELTRPMAQCGDLISHQRDFRRGGRIGRTGSASGEPRGSRFDGEFGAAEVVQVDQDSSERRPSTVGPEGRRRGAAVDIPAHRLTSGLGVGHQSGDSSVEDVGADQPLPEEIDPKIGVESDCRHSRQGQL